MRQFWIGLCVYAFLLSCREEITPLVIPSNPGNPNNPQNPGGTGKFKDCVPQLTNTSFDIVTWNIEQFAKEGNTTIEQVSDIILTLNADIIAVQEISNSSQFITLINSLPGWSGVVSGGSLRTGYLYKNSEVTVSAVTYPLADSYAFPRSPMFITATHTSSGLEVTLINLHLKCCDDGNSIPRRRDASQKLKAYIDANLSNKAVVMLGDYNEDITQPEGNDVFENFVNDAANYLFTDMNIAKGSSLNWSYPGWPSHLDHILITNELFDKVVETRTLKLNVCESQYYSSVSDHRPVIMRLE